MRKQYIVAAQSKGIERNSPSECFMHLLKKHAITFYNVDTNPISHNHMIMTCEYMPRALNGILNSLRVNITKQLNTNQTTDHTLLMLYLGVHMVMIQKRYSIDSSLLMSGITNLMNKEFVDKFMSLPKSITLGRGKTSDIETLSTNIYETMALFLMYTNSWILL